MRYFALLGILLICSPAPAQAQVPSDSTLLATARSGDAALLRDLLAEGVDPNVKDADGATALMWAAYGGHLAAAEALVEAGAQVDGLRGVVWTDSTRSGYYGGALAVAAGRGHLEVVRLLVERAEAELDAAEWNPRSERFDGWTPLQWASWEGHADVVGYLAEKGADPDLATNAGLPPLAMAEQNGHVAAATALRDAGAAPVAIASRASPRQQAKLARADSLYQQSGELYLQGRYAEAFPLAREALAIREAIFGPEHPTVAQSLNSLAVLLHTQGDYAAALPIYERALAVREAVFGPDHPDVAASLNNLAGLLKDQGDYAAARPLFERALSIREATLGPDHPDVAKSLSNLGLLLWAQGDYAAARPFYERALRVHEAALSPDHPDVATSLNNLAGLLSAQGDYAAARPLYERALRAYEAALGPEHPLVATSLSNLAALLDDLGDYAAARPLYERSLSIHEASLGPDHPTVATGLNNLAGLLSAQGDYAAALPIYERALAVRETALGPDHPDVATGLNNLAGLLSAQGDYAAALPIYERALAVREAVFGPDHPDVAASLNNLAGLLKDQGDYAAARPLFERALRVYEATLGPDHPDVATSLNNLASLLDTQGDYAAARPLYERSLSIHEATLGPDHPTVAASLNNLAGLLISQGDYPAARPLYERAARIYDGLTERLLPTLATAEQRAFVELDLGEQTSVLLSTHRSGADLSAAYSLLGGWKGLLLRQMRRQTAIAALADDPAHADDVAALQTLRARVARAYYNSDPALTDLTEEKERLERRLAAALPEGALNDPWRSFDEGGLADALPTGSAFVDLYRYGYWERGAFVETRYAAVVSAPGANPVLVDLGAAASLDDLLTRWREAVTAGAPALAETRALVDAAWDPIAAALPEGTARLWVSPDAQLARLPWATLAAESSRETAPGSTPDLLVAEVASGRALARLLTSEPPAQANDNADESPDVLLVGGVDFGAGDAGWAALPGTAREAERIAALAEAQGLDAQVLTDAAPTPATVAEVLSGAAYAHLATHGFFFQETEEVYASRGGVDRGVIGVEPVSGPAAAASYQRNPLVESGLALAGANAGPEGHLTAEELVGLDLAGTRLVALSACDTGRGREITGQGVLGLRASLEAAGAGAVLMSLWKVPDASTALLMEHFYRGLWAEGLAPAEALRRAQAAVRDTPGYRAPVHWAAWVLAGRAW